MPSLSETSALVRRVARNMRNHLFPCPRIRPSKDQGYMIKMKEPPIMLARIIDSGNRCAPDLVNVRRSHRFLGKDPCFIEEHARAGDTEAQFVLGLILYHDHEDKEEYNTCEHWIQRAAMGGNTHAMLFLASNHLKDAPESPVDGAIAVEWVRRAAVAGNAMAQETLAEIYDKALCHLPSTDHHEAFRWWRKAAIQGSEKAMKTLSDRYMKGKGVWKNYRASRIWFRRTLDQSLVD